MCQIRKSNSLSHRSQSNSLAFAVAIAIVALQMGCDWDIPFVTDNRASPELKVEETLQEKEWPIYAIYCLLFQTPNDFDVYFLPEYELLQLFVHSPDHQQNEREFIYIVMARHFRDSPFHEMNPDARELDIGGFDAYLIENRENDIYSGRIHIDVSHLFIEVVATYQELSKDERDLAIRIISSFRLNLVPPEPNPVPERGQKHRLRPVSDQEGELPNLDLDSNKYCP